jgi:hypothetical protein
MSGYEVAFHCWRTSVARATQAVIFIANRSGVLLLFQYDLPCIYFYFAHLKAFFFEVNGKKFPTYVEPASSLVCSQDSAIALYRYSN